MFFLPSTCYEFLVTSVGASALWIRVVKGNVANTRSFHVLLDHLSSGLIE